MFFHILVEECWDICNAAHEAPLYTTGLPMLDMEVQDSRCTLPQGIFLRPHASRGRQGISGDPRGPQGTSGDPRGPQGNVILPSWGPLALGVSAPGGTWGPRLPANPARAA